jgi:hypothetical protein
MTYAFNDSSLADLCMCSFTLVLGFSRARITFKLGSKPSVCKRTQGLSLAINGRSGWFEKTQRNRRKSGGPLQTCETDYDCNPEGRNWPLRCQNFIVAKFCIDPESTDDWFGGFRNQNPELVTVPIPVRRSDGFY